MAERTYQRLFPELILATARDLVLACVTRYRPPEPTRQVDIEVAALKRSG